MKSKLLKLGWGWRFIVVLIMVCTLASTLMVTTTATPVAAAHSTTVTISPDYIDMAASQLQTITVKNNTGGNSIKKVEVTLPLNFSVLSVIAPLNWTFTNTSTKITWSTTTSSAYIGSGATKSFQFSVIAPSCEFGSKDNYCFQIKTTDIASGIWSNCANLEVRNCAPAFEVVDLACTDDETPEICAQIIDSALLPDTATVYWSNNSGSTWRNASMTDPDEDGIFCAEINISGAQDCDEIWYYVTASDCSGFAGWDPAEAENLPIDSAAYHTFRFTSGLGPTIKDFQIDSESDCFTGGSTINVSWQIDEESLNCCDIEDITTELRFLIDGSLTSRCLTPNRLSTSEEGIGSATITLPMVNSINSSLQLVAYDCCGHANCSTIPIGCIQSSLTLFDAVTGWHWVWGSEKPVNANDRQSIMVIFNKGLDPATVSASDFLVTNTSATITSIELYNAADLDWEGEWSVVFLNLASPLLTDATPTVKVVGSVSDDDGIAIVGTPSVVCEDGIAPVLTLTATPTNPSYNQVVTVTLTSTETLCADICSWDCADLVCRDGVDVDVFSGTPDSSNWVQEVHMTPNPTSNGKVWTGTFVMNASLNIYPDDCWFIESSGCQCYDPCDEWFWKDEKCGQASLLFCGFDVLSIDLCEGWNLISVADTLVEPGIQKAFSRYISEDTYGPVTKVYYFTGGATGTWQFAVLNAVSGTWTGTITQIEPGKAYWVWCDDWDLTLMMRLAPSRTQASMPSIPIKAGWNMVGFWDITHQYDEISSDTYLASIATMEKLPIIWGFDCEDGWWGQPVPFNTEGGPGPAQMAAGAGYWLGVTQDMVIYPATQNDKP